ncbi:MAG TPA: alkaline phosphatase family protein [Terriglobales bacterium]|nr:alkaline phosphatase family protein [Terriglobales bacterium]
MKLATIVLLASISGGATIAFAQTNNIPEVQHVILVIQENRSPDNLFGSDAIRKVHRLPPGADLARKGKCYDTITKTDATITLTPWTLDACFDPHHGHDQRPPVNDAWVESYRNGNMDGACNVPLNRTNCGTPPCALAGYEHCAQYTFVDNSTGVLQPLLEIAQQYGFANYMFQTNQGPSYPAHQFLLSGTSAPVYNDGDADKYWEWFVAEIPYGYNEAGCAALQGVAPPQINPQGVESDGYTPAPPVNSPGFPCYDHNTLPDLLDANNVSWKYEGGKAGDPNSYWVAPNSILHLCGTPGYSGECSGDEWTNHVVIPPYPPEKDKMAPILSDLTNCTLPAMSWVIPDGSYSDHAGANADIKGPTWVAAIVNAVGGYDNSGKPLPTKCNYWSNTVVLVTWDDWGGWYDHVLPWNCKPGPGGTCQGYSNNTGSQYVYGFRVPLLVVSAYAKKGYISGALPPYGPGKVVPYVHDFGSILNFIEYAFGKNGVPLSFPGAAGLGISPTYPYADYLAPDAPFSDHNATLYSLSDFFDFSQKAREFHPLAIAPPYQQYNAEYYENYGLHAGDHPPADPDDDAIEAQGGDDD